ncbi:MAG TPA: PepSY-like domain-containing protein [Verrucomicrobiae bacterium]
MRTTCRILPLTAIVLAASLLASIAGEKEEKITMNKVPAAVQEAVKVYATGDQIKGIEKSDADGTAVIEFDLEKDGQSSEVAFQLDGKLFSTETPVKDADLPAAVKATIAEKSKKGKAGAPEKVVKDGQTTYEVVIEKKGKKTEYTLSPTGKVLDKEAVEKD